MACDPSQLLGMWLIEESRFRAMVDQAKDAPRTEPVSALPNDREPFKRTGARSNIAVIDINGPLTKYPTSFQELLGGTSTVEAKAILRRAANAPDVKAIVLRIDSPGGTVAGTSDFAAEVRRAKKSKPVYAVVDDMAASAAYWIASQADRIYANESAMIGSIGTVLTLYDQTKRLEAAGIKVHVIASSHFKATAQGGPITDEQLADVQRVVDELQAVFVGAIADGRDLEMSEASALADGRIHIGAKAQQIGLVDAVGPYDDAIEDIERKVSAMSDPIGAFASANPDAVKKWKDEGIAEGIAQGKTAGASAERSRFLELHAAFASRPAFVCEQFAKGATLGEAKGALADLLESELKTERDKSAKLQQKLESGSPGIPFNAGADAPSGTFDRHKLRPSEVSAEVDRQWKDEETRKKYHGNRGIFQRYLESEAAENVRTGRVAV